jgi:5,10-methylenetetrahydromethanopterin reductase
MVEIWTAGANRPRRTVEAARQAEAEGFDGLSFGDTQCIASDPFVGLAIAAAATDRLQLGVRVTNPVTRHPATTAGAIATVQVEFPGRVMIGVGRGDSAVGLIHKPAATVAELEDFLVQLQGYLAGEVVAENGPNSALQWLPADIPKVPVDVAATGPKVIAVAARHADQVSFNVGADATRLRQCIDLGRQARQDAGRDPDDLSFGAYLPVVGHPDRQIAHDLIRGPLAAYAHFSGMPGHPLDELDPRDAAVFKAVGEHYEIGKHARPDASHVAYIDEDFIDRFGVVGPVDYCVAKLAGLVSLGLDRIMLIGPHPISPPEHVAEYRRLLIEEVMPGLRKAVA